MLAHFETTINNIIMATDEEPFQIDIKDLAADCDREQTHDERQEESHISINYTSYSEELHNTPPQLKFVRMYAKVRSNFKNCRYCLWSSKAVILILVWNLIISIGLKSFFDPSLYTTMFTLPVDYYYFEYMSMIYGLSYGISALLFVFYPLAGFLADVCWGRYATVRNSLCFLLWSMVLLLFLSGLAVCASIPMFISDYHFSTITIVTVTVLSVVFGLPIFLGTMLFLCSTVAFSANVIQFGFDQLHDAPTDSSTLYVHWYVWTNQVGLFLLRLPSALFFHDFVKFKAYACTSILMLLAIPFLGITLCLEKYKRHWFLIEPGSANPYKLVYRVLKFAKTHTNPIRRSAFTYCEDELPSRLDLGKDKYGGPFTTEQVEDVKAFIGIVRIILIVGPTFFADVAFRENLPQLVNTNDYNYYYLSVPSRYAYNIYGSGCLTPLLMLFIIPLYLCLLRPLMYDYIPGMLKRMGLGMVLCLISGLCTLLMGVSSHDCTSEPCSLSSYFNISPHFLLSISI